MQLCLLFAYRFLLRMYPPAFRKRFAAEMLELAEAADREEWALILGDTTLGIVRCWLQPATGGSAAMSAGRDSYLEIGESGLTAARLLQGIALSLAIVLSLCYVGSIGYVELPRCHAVAAENISK